MLLPAACKQKFLCLRVTRELQGAIFFHDFVNADADLVFIGARFWLHCERDGRLWDLSWLVEERRALVTESIARENFLQLRDGSDISGVKFAHFRKLLPLDDLNVLETLLGIAGEIGQCRVVFQHAAFHFEIVDAARKRVGQRLEYKERKRLAVIIFALDTIALAAHFLESFLRVLIGMRKHIGEERE